MRKSVVALGSDHGGFELKEKISEFLKKSGYEIKDFGTHSKESCDYPMIGFEVAQAVGDGGIERGILLCKSGIGMAIIANKVHGVRAAACYDREMARSSREHNDCNILVLAANYINIKEAKEMLKIWLETKHLGERHARRVKQIREFEAKLKRR